MKRKIYLHLPAILLLVATFSGASSVAKADITIGPKYIQGLYSLCIKTGDRQFCELADALREIYYLSIIPKLDVPMPPCELVDCNTPIFDQSKINPGVLRDELIDIVDQLDQKIIELDKINR